MFMTWVFWLTVALIVAALAAVFGIKPSGTRPVARTSLMTVARSVLVLFLVIVVALYLVRRFGPGY